MENTLLYISIFSTLLAASVSGVFGCSKLEPGARSPRHDEYDEQKVYYSDYVMFGETKKVVSGDQFPYHDIEGIKTVEFVVDCVYKADKPITNRTIYVTGVGNLHNELPGCPAAALDVGKKGVLYLRRLQGRLDSLFEIEFVPFLENDEVPADLVLEELILVCELSLSQVFDLNVCYDVLEYPECIQYIPITPEPETTPDKEPEPSTEPDVIFTSTKEPEPKKESTVIVTPVEEPERTTAPSGPQGPVISDKATKVQQESSKTNSKMPQKSLKELRIEFYTAATANEKARSEMLQEQTALFMELRQTLPKISSILDNLHHHMKKKHDEE